MEGASVFHVTTGSGAPARPARIRLGLLATALFAAATVGALLTGDSPFGEPLFYVLLPLALVGSLLAARYDGPLLVSAEFGCSMIAVAFLGPLAVFLINVVAEAGTWGVRRYDPIKALCNLGTVTSTTVGAAIAFDAMTAGAAAGSTWFLVALAVVSVGATVANFVLIVAFGAALDGVPAGDRLRAFPVFVTPTALNVGVIVLTAGVYADGGSESALLVVLFVGVFGYMWHLVMRARNRTKEYANLSWGVLSSLVQTLDARDSRAARHCAAVARFSRDIAREAGFGARDQELAHTAGLLHDIGRFSLSDRVMERDVVLTEADWRDIRRHPEIGAMLLKDVGVYGPIDEIVRAHHERLDGRGYPRHLKGDEIPEMAKIVAVAEVYDTLTAPDTYRTPMSSFEALTELRRVSGTQLEGRYVEALATVLTGEGTDYRHADAADFDRELDIQRRMNDAALR